MDARQNFSRPSFFKMMTGDFQKKLKMPVNFIGTFNGMIPYDSNLRSPLGCWNVKVKEEEHGGLSFRKGWPDFVEAHCLGHEDVVIMKYIGNSQFSVKLYGRNGCEKVLPSAGSNGVKSISSRKMIEYGETSKGKVITNYGTNFDRHKDRADDIGRDSFCSDKRSCGLLKYDSLERKTTVRGTGGEREECSRKGKPYFLVIWTEDKKYQMEIPVKVVRKIGRTLSDIVALRTANGKLWNVELKRSEGKVWFHKGWMEFIEHHSLRDGHVLGITYNGNSQFFVRITDVMERLDDSINQGESNPKKRRRLSQREKDNVILLDAPPSRAHVNSKTDEERAELSFPPGLEVPIQLNKNKGTKSLVLHKTRSGERLPVAKEEEESEDTSDSPDASKLSRKSSRRSRSEGNERVAEVTKLFKRQTQNPFFAVCMRDSYLTNGYLVRHLDKLQLFHTLIPHSFAKEHLPKNIKNVMVRSSDDKVWTLGYYYRGYAARLSAGWTSLRRSLCPTEGDVCVFEVLKERDTEMRVSVYREIDNVLTRI